MRNADFPSRFWALFLALSILLPPGPAEAGPELGRRTLRNLQPVNSGAEEEVLDKLLGSRAGAEEKELGIFKTEELPRAMARELGLRKRSLPESTEMIGVNFFNQTTAMSRRAFREFHRRGALPETWPEAISEALGEIKIHSGFWLVRVSQATLAGGEPALSFFLSPTGSPQRDTAAGMEETEISILRDFEIRRFVIHEYVPLIRALGQAKASGDEWVFETTRKKLTQSLQRVFSTVAPNVWEGLEDQYSGIWEIENFINDQIFLPRDFFVYVAHKFAVAGGLVSPREDFSWANQPVTRLALDLWWADPARLLSSAGGSATEDGRFAMTWGREAAWNQRAREEYGLLMNPPAFFKGQWEAAWPLLTKELAINPGYRSAMPKIFEGLRRRSVLLTRPRSEAESLLGEQLRAADLAEEFAHARDLTRAHRDPRGRIRRWALKLWDSVWSGVGSTEIRDLFLPGLPRQILGDWKERDEIFDETLLEFSAGLSVLSAPEVRYPSATLLASLQSLAEVSVWKGKPSFTAHIKSHLLRLDAIMSQFPGDTLEAKAAGFIEALGATPNTEVFLRETVEGATKQILRPAAGAEEEEIRELHQMSVELAQAALDQGKKFPVLDLTRMSDPSVPEWFMPVPLEESLVYLRNTPDAVLNPYPDSGMAVHLTRLNENTSPAQLAEVRENLTIRLAGFREIGAEGTVILEEDRVGYDRVRSLLGEYQPRFARLSVPASKIEFVILRRKDTALEFDESLRKEDKFDPGAHRFRIRLFQDSARIPTGPEVQFLLEKGQFYAEVTASVPFAGMEEIALRELNGDGALFDVYGAGGIGVVYKVLKSYPPEEARQRGIPLAIQRAREGLKVAQERLGGMALPAAAFENITLKIGEEKRNFAYAVAQKRVPEEWLLDRVVRELVQARTDAAVNELNQIFSALKKFQEDLHDRGVVHLDTRLSNYVRDEQGRIWVADARLLTAEPTRFDITTYQSTEFSISLERILREESREDLFRGRNVGDEIFGDYNARTRMADDLQARRDAAGLVRPKPKARIEPMFRDEREQHVFEAQAARVFVRASAAGMEEVVPVIDLSDYSGPFSANEVDIFKAKTADSNGITWWLKRFKVQWVRNEHVLEYARLVRNLRERLGSNADFEIAEARLVKDPGDQLYLQVPYIPGRTLDEVLDRLDSLNTASSAAGSEYGRLWGSGGVFRNALDFIDKETNGLTDVHGSSGRPDFRSTLNNFQVPKQYLDSEGNLSPEFYGKVKPVIIDPLSMPRLQERMAKETIEALLPSQLTPVQGFLLSLARKYELFPRLEQTLLEQYGNALPRDAQTIFRQLGNILMTDRVGALNQNVLEFGIRGDLLVAREMDSYGERALTEMSVPLPDSLEPGEDNPDTTRLLAAFLQAAGAEEKGIPVIDLRTYRLIGAGNQTFIYQSPDKKSVVRRFRIRGVENPHVQAYAKIMNDLPDEKEGVHIPRVQLVRIEGEPAGADLAIQTKFVEGYTLADLWTPQRLTAAAGWARNLSELAWFTNRVEPFLDWLDKETGGLADRHYVSDLPGAAFDLTGTLGNFMVSRTPEGQFQLIGIDLLNIANLKEKLAQETAPQTAGAEEVLIYPRGDNEKAQHLQRIQALDKEFGAWKQNKAQESARKVLSRLAATLKKYASGDTVIIDGDTEGIDEEYAFNLLQAEINGYLFEERVRSLISSGEILSAVKSIQESGDEIARLSQWDFVHRFKRASGIRASSGVRDSLEEYVADEAFFISGEKFFTQVPEYAIHFMGGIMGQKESGTRIVVADIPLGSIRHTSWVFFSPVEGIYEPEIKITGPVIIRKVFKRDEPEDFLSWVEFERRYEKALRSIRKVDPRDLKEFGKSQKGIDWWFVYLMDLEFQDLVGDESLIGPGNVDLFRETVRKALQKKHGNYGATMKEIRQIIDQASYKTLPDLGGFLRNQFAAGAEERQPVGGMVFDGLTAAGEKGIVVAPDVLPDDVVISGLQEGKKRLVVQPGSLDIGGRIYVGWGIELSLETRKVLREAIGEERIISLPQDPESAHALLIAQGAGAEDLALLSVSAGDERRSVPQEVPVINAPVSLWYELTAFQLAGLEEAARRHGGSVHLREKLRPAWKEPLDVYDLAA